MTWNVAGSDPSDFVAGLFPQGSLTFLPGETTKSIAVPIAPDAVLEPNELVTVALSDPTGGTSTAAVTILNDDATVELHRIAASDQAEGNSGTTDISFVLVLTGDASIARSVSWMVTEYRESLGSYSVDASDFPGGVLPTGTVTFAPGETHKIFSVAVAGDMTSETSEVFDIDLFDPSPGLSLYDGSRWGSITNDDPLPVVAYDDAFVTTEGAWVSPLYSHAPSVLGNDIGATSIALLSGPSHGTVEENVYAFGYGSLTYKPDAGFHGIDTFTYRAIGPDGWGDAQVTVHVVPIIQGQSPTLNLLALTPEEQVAVTYVAFMGRAADSVGFDFWVDQFHVNLAAHGPKALIGDIASAFAVGEEAKGLYGFLANPGNASDGQISAFLDGVYRNLFSRSTDQAGLDYWTGQIKQKLAGGEFVGSVLVDIISGTKAITNQVFFYNDLQTLMSKVAVGLEFVRAQQENGMAWNGATDTAAATDLLKNVYSDPGTILLGIKHGDDYAAAHA
ncbi:MAG: DUF4214 domain-containing protein [Reyranellaceae bacterium]